MRAMLLVLLLFAVATAADAPTGQEIIDKLDYSPDERQRLESGEVLAFSGEPYENTPRELAADASVIVARSLDDVLQQIESVPSIIPAKLLIEHGDIGSSDDLDNVGFTLEEYDEASKLLDAKAGKSYNLSNGELEMLSKVRRSTRNAGRAEVVAAASQAMRDILKARYEQYMSGGLGSVPAYQRSKRKAISIGDELRLSTETLEPVEQHFGDYYKVLTSFPEGEACCAHSFRWLKAQIRKRPTFALTHTITQKGEDFLLVTERHYYVSNTLNSVQVTLAWLEWEGETVMGLAMSASTDILDSLMGRMLRPLGRNKASDMVTDILTDIRDELEQGS